MSDYRWCGRKGSVGCCTGHDEEFHAMSDELTTLRAALAEEERRAEEQRHGVAVATNMIGEVAKERDTAAARAEAAEADADALGKALDDAVYELPEGMPVLREACEKALAAHEAAKGRR